MLIGRPIAILYFLARKITVEGAEERRAYNRLFPLRVPLRTLRLNSRFGYNTPHIPSSSCTVKSNDSGFRYLSSYISSSLQVFLIIASATIATSPTSTLPLYFGLNTIWSVSRETVCPSCFSSFDIWNCICSRSIRINGKNALKVLILSHKISRINQANIYFSTTVPPRPSSASITSSGLHTTARSPPCSTNSTAA